MKFVEAYLPRESSSSVGVFQEAMKGPFPESVQKCVSTHYKGIKQVDAAPFFKSMLLTKTEKELEHMRIAGKLVELLFTELIEKVESTVDDDSGETNSKLASLTEGILEKDGKVDAFARKNKADPSLLELALPILVQSGGTYDFKLSAKSSDAKLKADTIMLSVTAKYADLCASASRTLLIGPSEAQKAAYNFLTDGVMRDFCSCIRAGKSISSVIKDVKERAT